MGVKPELVQDFINLCESIYFPPKGYLHSLMVQFDNFDNFDNLLNFLKENRLDHYFAIKYEKKYNNLNLLRLNEEYKVYRNNLKKNLEFLKSMNKEFIVIKTISTYPHITTDLDILVRDKKTVEVIKDSLVNSKYDNKLTIDISDNLSWGGVFPISKKFIWENIIESEIENIRINIPNPYLDILIRLAHIPFELSLIRLGELLHIYRLSRGLDWKILEDEAKNMGWYNTFKRIKYLLHLLHQYLFSTPLFEEFSTTLIKNKNYKFPLYLPFNFLAMAVIEKRAWRKILGARFIIKDRVLVWLKRNFH